MSDVCFVSVAFQLNGDDRYIHQQRRLRESVLNIYPDASILFFEDRMPRGSRSFYESLYGFKPHAIQEALDAGFKKVMWFDPAMILMTGIEPIVLKYPMVAVKDDSKLFRMVSKNACNFFQVSPALIEALDWHLVGGSMYYFNFNDMRVRSIFDLWMRAERQGCFGSQQEAASEQINGHRYDETCLALAMYGHRLYPIPPPDVRYCIEKDPIFTKKHFK